MPHSLFVLARLFLRVDNVLFRMFDVRMYHAFGSGEIIREINGMEAKYKDVQAVNLSPCRDCFEVLQKESQADLCRCWKSPQIYLR